MTSYKILLSNDDGSQSPFVEPFAQALSQLDTCKELRLVFPAEEQSWISQAVTRFRPLYSEKHAFQKQAGYLVNGTPADCVGLGLDHLYEERADYVVSGINLGTNATLPFYLSSGTVGAARQAFCFGVRAIAISALIPPELFHYCRENDSAALVRYSNDLSRIAQASAQIVSRLFRASMWNEVDLYSVNVPWELTKETEAVFTGLERATYRSLYEADQNQKFVHHFRGFNREPAVSGILPNDLTTLEAGKVSITPIRYQLSPSSDTIAELSSEFVKTS